VQQVSELKRAVGRHDQGKEEGGQRMEKRKNGKMRGRGEEGTERNKICNKYKGCYGNYFLNGI
jgi:hypothetical protein